MVKASGAQTWAGTTLTADGTLGFAHKLPFDAVNTRMTVRVYSPDSGIKVRLKVEDHANSGVFVETDATTTKSNAWETLTFDFAAPASAALDLTKTYDKDKLEEDKERIRDAYQKEGYFTAKALEQMEKLHSIFTTE